MDVLGELFQHNTMMNQRLLDACRPLTAEQLDASVVGTYGSIAATLVHIANGQVGYAARLLDTERPAPLSESEFPGFEALAERFALGNARLEEAARQPPSDRLVQVRGDDPPGLWDMPVGLYLLQAINHATEHRTQVATILTQLGIRPPEMDGWSYFVAADKLIPVASS